MTVEEIIDDLRENHDAALIVKGDFYYSVTIWDSGAGCYQDLELTEDELIDLYNEYFNFDNYTL